MKPFHAKFMRNFMFVMPFFIFFSCLSCHFFQKFMFVMPFFSKIHVCHAKIHAASCHATSCHFIFSCEIMSCHFFFMQNHAKFVPFHAIFLKFARIHVIPNSYPMPIHVMPTSRLMFLMSCRRHASRFFMPQAFFSCGFMPFWEENHVFMPIFCKFHVCHAIFFRNFMFVMRQFF